MLNVDAIFATKYGEEVTAAFENEGSLLRSQVNVRPVKGAKSLKVPTLDVVQRHKNRPRNTMLAIDSNDRLDDVTITFDDFEAFDRIKSLEEFKIAPDLRAPTTRQIINGLSTDMDLAIVTALAASNTSAGAAAAMNLALMTKVRALTYKNKWPSRAKRTWVMSSAVFDKLCQVPQYVTIDSNNNKPLTTGMPAPWLGFEIRVLPELDAAPFIVSSTEHKTFVFEQDSVVLGVNADITTKINYSTDFNDWVILGEMSCGAGVVRSKGVFQVNVNGL